MGLPYRMAFGVSTAFLPLCPPAFSPLTLRVKETYSHLSQDAGGGVYACVCSQVTDQEWTAALEKAGGDWLVASTATGAGLNCGSCRVYLQQTALAVVLPVLQPA